jgi:hypothetical protein
VVSKERKPKPRKGKVKVTKVKIIRGKGGNTIRTIVERGHTKPTGKFTSLKSGRAQPWEAIDERHFMWISEIDSRVRTFIAQPFRMEFYLSDGGMIMYFPDFERTLDGAIEIVEIKKTKAEASRDPYYASKLELARKTCKTMGWTFRIISADEEILPTRLFENARLIRLDRLTQLSSVDHINLGDAMSKAKGRLTYGQAVAALSGRDDPWDPTGTAKLHALIARRFVCIDLTRKITQSSLVVALH